MVLIGIILLTIITACADNIGESEWQGTITLNEGVRDSYFWIYKVVLLDEKAGKVIFHPEGGVGFRILKGNETDYKNCYAVMDFGGIDGKDKNAKKFLIQIQEVTVEKDGWDKKTTRELCMATTIIAKIVKSIEGSDETSIDKIIPSITNDKEVGTPMPEVIVPGNFAGIKDLQNFLNRYGLCAITTDDDITNRYVAFKSKNVQTNLTNWLYTSTAYLALNKPPTKIYLVSSHENKGVGYSDINLNDRIRLLSTTTGVITRIKVDPEIPAVETEIISERKPGKSPTMLMVSHPPQLTFNDIEKLLLGNESFEECQKYITKHGLLMVLIDSKLSNKIVFNHKNRPILARDWQWKIFAGGKNYYVFSANESQDLEFKLKENGRVINFLTWGNNFIHLGFDELDNFKIKKITSFPQNPSRLYPIRNDSVKIVTNAGGKIDGLWGSISELKGRKTIRIIVNDWVEKPNGTLSVYYKERKIHTGYCVGFTDEGTGNKILLIEISQ